MTSPQNHSGPGNGLADPEGELARWAARIVAAQRPLVAVDFGGRLIRRWTHGQDRARWVQDIVKRFAAAQPAGSSSDMVVAPYAPPQRQISAARQGAADWAAAGGSPPTSDLPAILKDLQERGWR